jgi:hypothetical protein
MKMKNIEIGGGRKVVAMMAQNFQKGRQKELHK